MERNESGDEKRHTGYSNDLVPAPDYQLKQPKMTDRSLGEVLSGVQPDPTHHPRTFIRKMVAKRLRYGG
jgi:hypothetical protein